MSQQILGAIGFSLIVGGIALAFVALLLLARTGRFKGSGGAVILIGPIPIILGSNKRITLVMITLTAILIIIFALEIYGISL